MHWSLTIGGWPVQHGVGIAGGFGVGAGRLRVARGLGHWLARSLETERRRWLLWLPVLVGAGSAGFFALPDQPPAWSGWLAAAVAAAGGAAAFRLRRRASGVGAPFLLACAATCFGFALAQARLNAVAAPILPREGVYLVEARVAERSPLPSGERLLLDHVVLEGIGGDATPRTIRVNVRRSPPDLAPGDRIRVRARLRRPLGPALPGAFDFARQAWFERLGAMGYALGAVELLPGQRNDTGLAIAELRARIAQRIAEENPGPAGAMAAALTAGVRAGIDQGTWRAMQVSGLAHILSVSGLHMVMVAGSVFAVCRWLLALCPPLALRFPVKKVAAALALLAAAFYLLLSGASVPAQRSFLMTAVGLVAVMADRNPFSLRLLACAALTVLIMQPEAVIGASFQLSFAAVLALMVGLEAWRRRARDPGAGEPGPGRAALAYLAGVGATTLVAGTATMPFAAFHFLTIPTYGLLANLIAVPLTTFVVMPAGMMGLLLMPMGLEGPCFRLMALGCAGVLWLARSVADLPGASILVHQWPGTALALLAFGGLWIGLWQQAWRWLGLAPVLAAVALMLLTRPPDLLVDDSLRMAAIRGDDGLVTLIEWRRDRLVRESWLRHLGVAHALPGPRPGTAAQRGVACDELGCVASLGGVRVALARRVEAAVEDCTRVALVIARVGPEACRGAVGKIGPRALRASGGVAVRRSGDGLDVVTVAAHRGDWPWTRPQTH